MANDILDELLLGTPHDTTDPSEMKLRKLVVTQMVKRYKKEWNMKPKEAEELHKQLMGTDNLTAMFSLDTEALEIAEKKKERNKRSRENKKKKKLMQQATVLGLKENDTVEKDSEDNSRPDSLGTTASVENLDTKLTRDTSVEKPKPEVKNFSVIVISYCSVSCPKFHSLETLSSLTSVTTRFATTSENIFSENHRLFLSI